MLALQVFSEVTEPWAAFVPLPYTVDSPGTSGPAGLRLTGGILGVLGNVLCFKEPHPPLPATACPLTSWQPKAQDSPPNASYAG